MTAQLRRKGALEDKERRCLLRVEATEEEVNIIPVGTLRHRNWRCPAMEVQMAKLTCEEDRTQEEQATALQEIARELKVGQLHAIAQELKGGVVTTSKREREKEEEEQRKRNEGRGKREGEKGSE